MALTAQEKLIVNRVGDLLGMFLVVVIGETALGLGPGPGMAGRGSTPAPGNAMEMIIVDQDVEEVVKGVPCRAVDDILAIGRTLPKGTAWVYSD